MILPIKDDKTQFTGKMSEEKKYHPQCIVVLASIRRDARSIFLRLKTSFFFFQEEKGGKQFVETLELQVDKMGLKLQPR